MARPFGLGRMLLLLLALAAGFTVGPLAARARRVSPFDQVPRALEGGRVGRNGPHVVLRLAGSPAEMGRQHGLLLAATIRAMVAEYVRPQLAGAHGQRILAAARELRKSLPAAYVSELDACARAAHVDPAELLAAQCLGDLQSAVIGSAASRDAACSAYVAFGPASGDRTLLCGRNLDYFFGERTTQYASLVTYYAPASGDGFRFVAVGLAGVLGGWTLINEKGLIVANHLGGGMASRLDGLPTLILTRHVAQRAATVDEAIDMIRQLPRMRGQIIWLAQEADPASRRPARAAAVEYDAESAAVRQSEAGLLIVTNENRAAGAPPPHLACARYRALHDVLQAGYGRVDESFRLTLLAGVMNESTVQSVEIHPAADCFDVRFRLGRRMEDPPVRYELPRSSPMEKAVPILRNAVETVRTKERP